MSRLTILRTPDGVRLDISPNPWFKPFAILIVLLASVPSWAFVIKTATPESTGYTSTLHPGTFASQSLLEANAYLATITILGMAIAAFLVHSYVARETLNIQGGQLFVQRTTNRWTKVQNLSFDLREIKNVHLAHVGRAFPPALAFTYREKQYYAAKTLSIPDTARVVDLLEEAIEASTKI